MKDRKFLEGIIVGMVFVIAINMLFHFAVPAMITPTSGGGFDRAQTDKMNMIYNIIDAHFVDNFYIENLERGMFMGLMYGLGDPYASYLCEEEHTQFQERTSGVFAGIGAVVTGTEDGRVMVVSPFDGSPAAEAGIMAQDVVMAVDGTDTLNMGVDLVVAMLRGTPGTDVTITIFRESEDRTFDLTVTRAFITVQTVSSRMLEDNIGHIRLSGFEQVTYDQFKDALDELQAEGAQGFIIDVRNNPGGLLDIVADIANLLVPEGIIVYTEDRHGHQSFLHSDANYLGMPIVVLVNGNSASASEVLAGAVSDHGVGILVGEQTFGKATVQRIFGLPDGSAVKLTIARYFTPSGTGIHGYGITPHHIVEMEPSYTARIASLDISEDVQLQKAVEVMNNLR